MQRLKKVLHIRQGEAHRTLVLSLQFFFVTAVTIAGKSARDTYFLSRYNKSYLPLMFIACAVAVTLASSLYAHSSRRFKKDTLDTLSIALFAGVLLLFRLRVQGWVVPALYVWIELASSLVTFQFWLRAAEIYDPRQAKRLFGLIAGGGSVAAILVGTSLKPAAKMFGSDILLWIVIFSLAASWLVGRAASRFAVARPRPALPGKPPARRERLDRYLLAIALVVGLSAIVTQIVDYQFKIIAGQTFTDEANLAGFFGHFYASTGLATLLMQFFVTGFVLPRLGILAGLLALPLALNLGTFAILFQPRLASAVLAKFSDQTFKFTLNNSSLELLWLPVPALRRQTVRPLVSGAFKSCAEGLAGLMTFFLMKSLRLEHLSLISLGAIAVWIVLVFRLRSLYVKALAQAIDKRMLDFEELTIDAQDPEMVAVLEKTLRTGDEFQQLFALDLMDGLPLQPWASTIRQLYAEGPVAVRKRILSLTADEPDILPDGMVTDSMANLDGEACEAIRVAGSRRLASALPKLAGMLDHSEARIRVAAAAAILELGLGPAGQPEAVLDAVLEDSDPRAKAAAVELLAGNSDLLPSSRLARLLAEPSIEVREAALKAAASRGESACLQAMVLNLGVPKLHSECTQALLSFEEGQVLEAMEQALRSPSADRPLHIGIVRTLAAYRVSRGHDVLLRMLRSSDFDLAAQSAVSLFSAALTAPLPKDRLVEVAGLTRGFIHQAYRWNRMLALIPESEEAILLRDYLEHRFRRTLPMILRLRAVQDPKPVLETCIEIVQSRDAFRLPLVLELLDNVLDIEERPVFCPLVEPVSARERDAIAARHFNDLPANLFDELRRWARSPEEWEAALAIDYLQRIHRRDLLEGIDWDEAAGEAMYTTLEKTILLKSVGLFREIPSETLSRVARIAEEMRWPAGAGIFREGDYADCLFIVVEGAVGIHRNGAELAVLHKGECLGEMGLLDQAPRSAGAVAAEECVLLRIGQEAFYEVMSAYPEIMRGIIRLFARRVREVNEILNARA